MIVSKEVSDYFWKTAPQTFRVALIILAISVFKPSTPSLFGLTILLVSITFDLLVYFGWNNFKNYLLLFSISAFAYWLLGLALVRYGVVALIVFVFGFAAYKLFTGRKQYLFAIKSFDPYIDKLDTKFKSRRKNKK